MSDEMIRVGIYVSVKGEKFDCLFFPSQRLAIAIKMPNLTPDNNAGPGQKFCEICANDRNEAKSSLENFIGPGSW